MLTLNPDAEIPWLEYFSPLLQTLVAPDGAHRSRLALVLSYAFPPTTKEGKARPIHDDPDDGYGWLKNIMKLHHPVIRFRNRLPMESPRQNTSEKFEDYTQRYLVWVIGQASIGYTINDWDLLQGLASGGKETMQVRGIIKRLCTWDVNHGFLPKCLHPSVVAVTIGTHLRPTRILSRPSSLRRRLGSHMLNQVTAGSPEPPMDDGMQVDFSDDVTEILDNAPSEPVDDADTTGDGGTDAGLSEMLLCQLCSDLPDAMEPALVMAWQERKKECWTCGSADHLAAQCTKAPRRVSAVAINKWEVREYKCDASATPQRHLGGMSC